MSNGDRARHSHYTTANSLHELTRRVLVPRLAPARSHDIIEQTLKLLDALSLSFNVVRRLLQLESVEYILQHHSSEEFQFLHHTQDTRLRTTFYAVRPLLSLGGGGMRLRLRGPSGIIRCSFGPFSLTAHVLSPKGTRATPDVGR